MEDRSALFNQLKNFSQRKLKKVETKVVTASGEQLVEKRGAKGLQVLSGDSAKDQEASEPARKLDLQVGFILPGLLIGSQDVAHDKSSLDSYGITHILNLDSQVENKFEDDYNYKNVNIQDKPEFDLDKVLEDCFDFIDDGRHYGNVLVHCSGTIGLSRSTSICVAYLMSKEKQKLDEAFNNVKEARSFVKPNDGFLKQLKEYEVKLRGAQEVKDSGIDDPFALRKKQEIEQEKAMVAGAASVKNRMKLFGATLDANSGSPQANNRSMSVSPSPYSKQLSPATNSTSSVSSGGKWGSSLNNGETGKSISKSMTPEPRAKSWRDRQEENQKPSADWRQSSASANKSSSASSGPPPPPPPMPTGLHASDKSVKPLSSSNKSSLPPPPPPPPPSGDLLKQAGATDSTGGSVAQQRMVFGRVPPPPMKIKGGLSIEKHDSTGDKNSGFGRVCSSVTTSPPSARDKTHLGFDKAFETHSQSPHKQLRLPVDRRIDQRCESPLVLLNNTSRQGSISLSTSPQILDTHRHNGNQTSEIVQESRENPFKFWQNTLSSRSSDSDNNQAPKRTMSLGPRRPPSVPKRIGEGLKDNPFIRDPAFVSTSRRESFNKVADELQSSLTDLTNLIEAPHPKIRDIRDKFVCSVTKDDGKSTNYFKLCDFDHDDQESPLNRRASTSINDLRSVFEVKASVNSSLPPPTDHRPPRSTSSNVLKNSPWQNLSASEKPPQLLASSGQRVQHFQPADYTIRRTTSTSSRPTRPIWNPYRSQSAKSSLQLPLKKQFTADSSDGESGARSSENPRAPSPSAALRAVKQQVADKHGAGAENRDETRSPTNANPNHRQSVSGQLNRSSTKKLLNLIKTKTKTDLTLPDGDENDEIEALLGALESESIENIDWDELGLDEDEVKDIIERGACRSSSGSESSSSSSSSSDSDEETEEEIEEEVETQHYVIRTK